MHLDTITMTVVNISVTVVLAGMLLLTWGRDAWVPDAGPRFVGSWGLAVLVQGFGVAVMFGAALGSNDDLVATGASMMVLASALKWSAARQYAERKVGPIWIVLGPTAFLVVAYSDVLGSFDDRLIVGCLLLAAYNIAAAMELKRAPDALPRWPAITLLLLLGAGYLSWMPFALNVSIQHVDAVFSSRWFPIAILATMLLRVALAFVVLSMAKEREEQEQRHDALTDSLTGLPNRRALFEAADAAAQRRILGGTLVSVVIFDLDHFKDTNDSYGHSLGDEVLKIFAITAKKNLKVNSIVGRLGGEEFAAILSGADAEAAVATAERVRRAFSRSAAFVNGLAVGSTVSVGVASDTEVDSDLSGLFRRADAALYAAKRAGRNQVALIGSDDEMLLPVPRPGIRTSPSRLRRAALLKGRDPLSVV